MKRPAATADRSFCDNQVEKYQNVYSFRLVKDVILAPGINIRRVPVCGRNFEYMSEDLTLPYAQDELICEVLRVKPETGDEGGESGFHGKMEGQGESHCLGLV